MRLLDNPEPGLLPRRHEARLWAPPSGTIAPGVRLLLAGDLATRGSGVDLDLHH